jgi:hypothetical protein
VVSQKIGLGNTQIPIQHIEELTLNSPYIFTTKDTCAQGPMCILECTIVCIFRSNHERAQKYTLENPFFESDGEMWACAGDIDKGGQNGCGGDFGA